MPLEPVSLEVGSQGLPYGSSAAKVRFGGPANSLRSDSAGPFTFAAPGITKSAWRKALRTNLQGHLKLRRMLMSVVYWSFIENRINKLGIIQLFE